MNLGGGEAVRVLLVDSDESFADIAATHLEQVDADMDVTTEVDAQSGLERLEGDEFECVVSDYKMLGLDGLDFLAKVRGRDPTLPFILFTGKGSEEIASEAISAGVTDYVRKGGGEQYTILAARIRNAVSRYRAERAVDETRERFRKLIEGSSDAIAVLDRDGTVTYASPAIERFVGLPVEEVAGSDVFQYVHPDDRERVRGLVEEAMVDEDQSPVAEFRLGHADGSWRPVVARGNNLLDDPAVEGFVVNVRDVSDRPGTVARERELELAVDDDDLFFKPLGDRASGDVSTRGAVLGDDGEVSVYLDVDGIPPDRILEFGDSSSDLEEVVAVSTHEDGGRFELRQSFPGLFELLSSVRADVRGVTASNRRLRLLVALPGDVDGESIVTTLRESHDHVEVVSQRTQPASDAGNRQGELTEELTDRQLEVLQYAFFGGYFEWPRTTTGEELADTLDIASPTFQNHLRTAERKVLSSVFDGQEFAD